MQEFNSITANEDKRFVEKILVQGLIKQSGGELFTIGFKWVQGYKQYLYENADRPGPVDNTDMQEFIIINEQLWKFLLQEYGGGPEIKYTRSKQRSVTVEPQQKEQNVCPAPFEIPLIGLVNESYFCYLHSVLQSLLTYTRMNYYFLRISKWIPETIDMKYYKAYVDLIDQLKNTKVAIKAQQIRALIVPKFSSKVQHDSHEILHYLLGQIDDELIALNAQTRSKQVSFTNFVDLLLKGKTVSRIICGQCRQGTRQTESFLTLSLALSNSKTIEQCLEEFSREERLKDYECNKCKLPMYKRVRLYDLPKMLILHLKRFSSQQHKSTRFIEYPLESLKVMDRSYRLKSVIVHTGDTQKGHYFNYAKRYHLWYKFNDDIVTQTTPKEVLNQQAYILFYQQNEQ